jgi:hypothetical protein
VARRRQLNPCATSRDGRHIHGSRRVGRVLSHRTGRIIRLGTARCNCGGRADEVGGDGGPDVCLLGEGTEASGVWIGRRGLIGFMQTGCFGLLGFFAAPVCKHSYFL